MRLNKWGLGAAAVAIVAIAGAATLKVSTSGGVHAPSLSGLSGRVNAAVAALGLRHESSGPASRALRAPAGAAGSDPADRGTYIVVFKESPLGTYRGEVAGLAAPKRSIARTGKLRLDVKGVQAKNYVAYLQQRQSQHESRLGGVIGRGLDVRMRMQHAINGIVTDLTRDEADRIGRMPEVQLVDAYREIPMDTDTGPVLIGANLVWDGSAAGAAYQGEGVVFGIIDSGINFGSPSFAAVDPVDGYQHVNPLGAGTYLGTCLAGDVDEGRCNDKLIGGYDFVCGAPGNQCGVTNIREEPGFGDTSGHGSHTASTAAGNRRDADFRGVTRRISGVAPRGNVIAYDVCYTNTATGQGLCPNVSSVAAVNQAIADGIVDVFNFSIGGGAQPWSDAVSLAFLSATNAGIYVAASAGNSGPGANTLGHVEPWVSSTAAAQHGRGNFSILMQVTGPAPVPAPLTAIILSEGSNGVAHTAAIPATTPLVVSPTFAAANDACNAFAANTFQNAIAVVRRGTCSFAIKTNNASAAGAIAVVIANNVAGALLPSVPGTTVPAFGAEQADGVALANFHGANPTATAMIGFPATPLPNVADALAAFSSRGPAGNFDLLKPDVTAPGVLVLAAYAGDTITGFENLVNTISGTSMASPHQAGAAGLVRQARPNWTVPEIKSALMMTAKQQVFLEDQVTPANPFARGAGRIQVDKAINAGLVMDETGANYLAADPATGGDPSALNQPSFANGNCTAPCRFTRTFRNPTATAQHWEVRVGGGLRNGAARQPQLFRVPANGTVTVTFSIDVRSIAANNAWNFGTVSLLPLRPLKGPAFTALHIPVAIKIQPPVIVIPALVNASAPAGGTGTGATSVENQGGSPLDFTVDNSGTGLASLYEATRGAVNSGFRNTSYTDPATAGNNAQFSSDDFTLAEPTQISSLFTEGFVVSGATLAATASNISWSIFADAGGFPAGDPETSAGSALWSYSSAPTGAGVSTDDGNIGLNLAAAGQNVVLPAGRYWLVVRTRSAFANRWAQFGSVTGDGTFASLNVSTTNTGAWAANSAFAGLNMRITGLVACGAPWLGAFSPSVGVVAPGDTAPLTFNVNAASLGAGTYNGFYCLTSNDPVRPKVAGRVSLQVN
jgi:subtilisin family serine protease